MSGTIGDARKRHIEPTEVDEVRELIRAACEKAWNEGHHAAVTLNQTLLGEAFSDPDGNPYRPHHPKIEVTHADH